MKALTQKAGIISLLMHVVALLLMFLGVFWNWLINPEPEEHVFVMVEHSNYSEPELDVPSPDLMAEILPEPEIPELDKLEKVDPIRVPEIPDPVEPEIPQPKPKPKPKKISLDEFKKQNKIKDKPNRVEIRKKPKKRIDLGNLLDPNEFRNALESSLSDLSSKRRVQSMDHSQRNAFFTWQQQVLSVLNQAFRQPSNVNTYEEATVYFKVLSNGQITNMLIQEPSGNSRFDNAVKDVFVRIRRVRPSPDKKEYNLAITFRQD